jgi:nucleotide-binding universal stress UspA family protein
VTYATMMVHLQPGKSNLDILEVTRDLAIRFGAAVIGVTACQLSQTIYGDVYVAADIIEDVRNELKEEVVAAEAEFRSALDGHVSTFEWRSDLILSPLVDYLTHQARTADLFITGVDHDNSLFDVSRHVDVGDLVMQLGRPALIVPHAMNTLHLNHVVIGWKDTRESRRATLDALPLLAKATHVSVVEIAADKHLGAAQAHLQDVVGWLARHGIKADSLAAPKIGEDSDRLNAIADERGADLVVAGAYGHSRLREWALGGVTHDLLLRAQRCSLVSH